MLSLSQLIKQAAVAHGFDVVGIACVDPVSSASLPLRPDAPSCSHKSLLQHLLDWLSAGYHGTMQWMAKNPERRGDPRNVLPGCRSIICVGTNYWTDMDPEERAGYGRIARYAWGQDYHRVLKRRLKNLEQSIVALTPEAITRSYVDTGPVMEKVWAQRAGLGWIGKHTNLVSPTFGSWLLLGEILTTLELEADDPGTDLCGTCTLCIQACPTHAITEPYVVDATQCISYLTIECRGDLSTIPQERRSQMGNRIFGCDDCLDICPYNVYASPTIDPAFFPTVLTQSPNLTQLSQMNEETFTRTFQSSPIRRSKHAGLQRNVQVALSNETTRSTTASADPQS